MSQEQLQQAQVQIDAFENEKSTAAAELDQLQLKYSQLRLDYTDLRDTQDKQRHALIKAEQDLEQSNLRFETLKTHAEQKLGEYLYLI